MRSLASGRPSSGHCASVRPFSAVLASSGHSSPSVISGATPSFRLVLGAVVAIHRSAAGFPETGSEVRQPPPVETDIATMADNLGTDLHQFFPQCRQRPMLHFFRQGQRLHEVGQIVGQGMKLEPDGIVAERTA